MSRIAVAVPRIRRALARHPEMHRGLLACGAGLLACGALTALAGSPPAPATAPSAATDNGVMTVTADQSSAISSHDKERTKVTYSGHVVVKRDGLRLLGDKAVIHARTHGIRDVVVTGGPARFAVHERGHRTINGTALSITYTASNDTLRLDGRVHFSRPGETFSASHVTYRIDTRRLEASGKDSGRVHAVLSPAAGSSP